MGALPGLLFYFLFVEMRVSLASLWRPNLASSKYTHVNIHTHIRPHTRTPLPVPVACGS